MQYNLIDGKHKVSVVGIGGHYSKMEEGHFENRYAEVEKSEIDKRRDLIQTAVENGINYFDTTWRNEVDMLAKSINELGVRDKIFINGMVLGVFSGSKACGMSACDYMNKWLDERLVSIGRFNSFMINAIEEQYDEGECEKVIRLLEKRKNDGDFDVIGFSCHSHALARKIADTFNEFKLIMLAYNYHNRSFESAFDGYMGNASFVAMKPFVWHEYGIPFCIINNNPDAEKILGTEPRKEITADAVKWIKRNTLITTVVCAVNNMEELSYVIEAGKTDLTTEGEKYLELYQKANMQNNHIDFLKSAIYAPKENRRALSFGLSSLARALNIPYPNIPLNAPDSDKLLDDFREKLISNL